MPRAAGAQNSMLLLFYWLTLVELLSLGPYLLDMQCGDDLSALVTAVQEIAQPAIWQKLFI